LKNKPTKPLRNILKKILNTFLCYSICVTISAQKIPLDKLFVRHINQKDGLLFNTVYCFLQDSKNYMWMGGLALQRYDGYRFKNYFNGSENINVHALLEDNNKQIWAGTDNGLYKLNRMKDKFELFTDSIIANNTKQKLDIKNMASDKQGTIWLACKLFYARLQKDSNKIEEVSTFLNHSGNGYAFFLYIDSTNLLWTESIAQYGITAYNIDKKKLYSHDYNPNKNPLFDLSLKNMSYLHDKKGNLWMTNGFDTRILYRYNTSAQKLFSYNLKPPPQYDINKSKSVPGSMLLDKKGDFWIQLNEHFGLARYDDIKDNFEYLFANKNIENSLYDDFSSTNPSLGCYADNTGNIWYCGDGINILNPSKQMFIVNKGELKEVQKLNNSVEIKQLRTTPNGFVKMNDSNYYFVYYGDGLWQYDKNFNPIKKISLPTNAFELLWSIFSTDGENLFFCDQLKHLFTMNIRNKQVKQISPSNFPENFIVSSYIQDKENIWLGLYKNGIALFNTKTYKTVVYNIKPSAYDRPFTIITQITPEADNKLWLSADYGGLHLFEKQSGTITKSWYPNPKTALNAKENHINGMQMLGEDSIFLCTDAGVAILNKKTMQHTTYSIKEGLPDNSCLGALAEDDRKHIWISTANKGIVRFNIKTKTITTFPISEGNTAIHGDFFETKLEDGKFLFTNLSGFTYFNPSDFNYENEKLKVTITEVLVNGKHLNIDSALQQNSITLTHKFNNIKIKFSTLNIWESDKIKYFIKLNDAKEWTKLETSSEVEYLNLAPAIYNFKIAASLEDNPISNVMTDFAIKIKPPFYKTWWFLLCGFIFSGFLVYSFLKWRLLQVRNQAALKQKVIETQMQALRAQMNPHFIFNSLNSIENFILQNKKRLASDYLNKFARLIRMILDSSRNELVPFAKDMEALQLYIDLEQLRFNNKFNYKTNIDSVLLSGAYFVPSLLIQPYVENAILHGLAHSEVANLELTVTATLENDFIKYIIIDNGIGRKQAAFYNDQNKPLHESVGLKITEDRINIFNKSKNTIKITDLLEKEKNCGTKIEITIKAI
jgi:ligand-binding sensor domain-containing protein